MHTRSLFALTALFVAVAASSAAQQVSAIDDSTAADVAKAIHDQSQAIRISGASSQDPTPERAMQQHVDEIAAIAAELEQEIRSGGSREATVPIYRRLRAARYRALQLAIHEDVPIDPADALLFNSMMDELKLYYAHR